MFKIYDGREQFFQWDRDRKLIVLDGSIKEVHFCNKTDDCSLKREVYEENNLHLVDVPNILLQDNWRIYVYGYDTAYTKHYAVFNVVARSKPEDYIYTEEELKEWEELEARIKALEEKEVDLTGYATEEYVNNATSANTIIKPVPIREKKFTATMAQFYIDIEQLESGFCYGLPTIPEEEKRTNTYVRYSVYCDDGTIKNCMIAMPNQVYSVLKIGNKISLVGVLPAGLNTEYKIDITDKSTASKVVVNSIRNRDFLAINNTAEFTPTSAYQPATKKYVDDSVSANNIITPFPVREKQSGFINYQFIDIEQLENGKTYGINVTDYDGKTTYAAICAYCSNGKRLNLLAIGADNFVYVIKSDNSYELHPSNTNTYVEVDITDKTSSNTIHINSYTNAKYLDINGDNEFTPEYDYQPATKKYVDEAIANAIAALRAELTATE